MGHGDRAEEGGGGGGGGGWEHMPKAEERERIDRIACFVARDREGDLAEALLRRLLRITGNHRRWGFLSPDHPHNVYYLQRKVSERCRLMRPPPPSSS